MRTILIVGLILIASGNVYSGEKEYTSKTCVGKNNCNECNETKVSKVSFKVSKSLGSVMRTEIKRDGTKSSSTIDNCKIFDEDNFECKTTVEAFVVRDDYANEGTSYRFILSNGEWEETNWFGRVRIGSKVGEEINYFSCGKEIKSFFNFFK